MTDTDMIFFFGLTNQIINCERKPKTSKANYMAHTRQNVESFFITKAIHQIIKSPTIMEVCVCSTPDAVYKGKDDLLCLFTLHPNEEQSLHHLPISGTHCAGTESKMMEGPAPALQVLHTL